MVRTPCCEKMGMKKGPWTPEEDQILVSYIKHYGHANWRALPRQAGLLRCGKSCRLRWINYLRPDIKRGNFTKEEEETILKLHQLLGNRWSTMAAKLPGRTDNEIKNYWHTHLKKKLLRNTGSSNYSLTINSISSTINYDHHKNIGFVHSKFATNVNPMDLITTSPSTCNNNMVPVIQSLSHARDQDEQSTAKEDATWKLLSKCSATNATLLLDHHNNSSRTMNNDERRVSDVSKNIIDDEEIMQFWYNLFVGSSGDQVPSRLLINGRDHFGCR